MRLFRALCATLGGTTRSSVDATGGGLCRRRADAVRDIVLTKDGQLVDTLTIIDPSRTMSESACQPTPVNHRTSTSSS